MAKNNRRVLRRRDVEELVGLSRSTIYRLLDQGRFPQPIPLTRSAVGWLEHEVSAWVEDRQAERDAELERVARVRAASETRARPVAEGRP